MRRLLARRQRAVMWMTVLALALGMPGPLLAGAGAAEVTPDQARALVQQRGGRPDFVVLDVRTPEEFTAGHLPGALNLNVLAPDFEARLGRLDRGKTYLVYCRTGNRSAQAVRAMERLGFRSVSHMPEGVVGWQRRGLPLVRTP